MFLTFGGRDNNKALIWLNMKATVVITERIVNNHLYAAARKDIMELVKEKQPVRENLI